MPSSSDSVSVPRDVLQRVQMARQRELAAVTSIPTMPQHSQSPIAGLGVNRAGSVLLPAGRLRQLRNEHPILKVIHTVRGRQIRTAFQPLELRDGAVGYQIVHKDHHHANRKAPDGFDRYIDRFREVADCPAPAFGVFDLADVAQPLWEDLATLNQPAIEILRKPGRPDIITGFRPVDGALIFHTEDYLRAYTRLNPGWREHFTEADLVANNYERARDLLSSKVGADITRGDYVRLRDSRGNDGSTGGRYAVIQNNLVEAVLDAEDLILRPLRNSTDVGQREYFASYVESAAEFVVGVSNAIEYNTRLFGDGLTTNKVLLVDRNMSGPALRAFKDTMIERMTGARNAHSLPTLPSDLENPPRVLDLATPATDMMYESTMAFMVAMACAVYRMNPATVNSKLWSGGGGAALSEPSQDTNIQLAQEEGLQADGNHIALMLSEVAKRCHPDLRVIAVWGGENQQQLVEISSKSAACFSTRNEERVKRGLAPMGFYLTPEELAAADAEKKALFHNDPWNQPTDAGFVQARQSAVAAQQMADQQSGADGYGQPTTPPPFGAPPGAQQGAPAAQPGQPPPPGQQAPQMPPNGQQPPANPVMAKAARRVTIYVSEV